MQQRRRPRESARESAATSSSVCRGPEDDDRGVPSPLLTTLLPRFLISSGARARAVPAPVFLFTSRESSRHFGAMATNIAAQRIKREFKEVIKSEEVSVRVPAHRPSPRAARSRTAEEAVRPPRGPGSAPARDQLRNLPGRGERSKESRRSGDARALGGDGARAPRPPTRGLCAPEPWHRTNFPRRALAPASCPGEPTAMNRDLHLTNHPLAIGSCSELSRPPLALATPFSTTFNDPMILAN